MTKSLATRTHLAMKDICERCSVPFGPDAEAFICSHECTFCADCTTAMNRRCPNCGGELTPRPHR
jgi:hypothetical protein